jgi:molybdate transport system substrate-binding protein
VKPLIAFLAAAILASGDVDAETARIAVATNFAPTAEEIAAAYGSHSGHGIEIVAGATGKLFAQIKAGAPFDAFLSADQAAVQRLAMDGLADGSTGFTYATGQLVLWSADGATDLTDPGAALARARHVAIANPDLAPYGKAAIETLVSLGLPTDLGGRIVVAQNVGQAQALVASGAAGLGFVAASGLKGDSGGAVWQVPADLHAPILQDAILLTGGSANSAAIGFLDYLRTDAARRMIAAAGYASR